MEQQLGDFPDTILWHDFDGIYDAFTSNHQYSRSLFTTQICRLQIGCKKWSWYIAQHSSHSAPTWVILFFRYAASVFMLGLLLVEQTNPSKERNSSCSPWDAPWRICTEIMVLQTGVSNSGRITVFGAVFFSKQTASALHIHMSTSLMLACILLAQPLKDIICVDTFPPMFVCACALPLENHITICLHETAPVGTDFPTLPVCFCPSGATY